MRYVALASADYGLGRVLAYSGRLGWRNAGGQAISDAFARRLVEWASSKGGNDTIEICHISVEGVDGITPVIDTLDRVSVVRKDIDFLSEDNNLSRFACVIISGYSSSSPLVRGNVLSYVASGGGLMVEDFRTSGPVDLLDAISPFSVSAMGFLDISGAVIWTDEGKVSSLFSESFLSEQIPMINSVAEADLGVGWSIMSVFDTDGEAEDGIETELVMISSDDIDLSGEYFIASYRSVYEDGIIDFVKFSSSSSRCSSSSSSSSSSSAL